MRILSSMFVFVHSLLSAQAVSIVAFSESKHSIRGFTPSGEIVLPAVRSQLDIHHSNGKDQIVDLTIVFDSQSGPYFWKAVRLENKRDANSFVNELTSGSEAVYIGSSTLIDFYMPGDLWVQEYSQRADSLEAAQRESIDEINKGLAAYEINGFATRVKEVLVARRIGNEFICGEANPTKAYCGTGAKRIISIRRVDDKWRLVVRNHYDQEIILDGAFNFLSTRRLSTMFDPKFGEATDMVPWSEAIKKN